MAKTTILTLSVAISGDGTSDTFAPPGAITNSPAPSGGTYPITLASGANTIAVPASAKGFICSPPTNSTNAKTLKGVAGDTGVPMGRARITPYLFDEGTAPPASIVVNSAAIETVDWLWL